MTVPAGQGFTVLNDPEDMSAAPGPCDVWPVRWPCEVPTSAAAVTGSAVEFATTTLWALSGRRFGLCPITIRPCRRDCVDLAGTWLSPWPPGLTYPQPALVGGQWYNLACGCSLAGDCSCTNLGGREVVLPAPAASIDNVKINGDTLSSSAYDLQDNRIVVRTDGYSWPWCNDLTKSDTASSTWSITANFGENLPAGADWAVGELACEYLRAFSGDDCRLSRNVTQLVRQGVTIDLPDLGELFKNGRTGLYLCDTFITTWNPKGLASRSRTYSVDRASARRSST